MTSRKKRKHKSFRNRQANKYLAQPQNNNRQANGFLTVTLGIGFPSEKIIWAKLNADTEEGKQLLLLCLKRKLRKHEFERLLDLTNRG